MVKRTLEDIGMQIQGQRQNLARQAARFQRGKLIAILLSRSGTLGAPLIAIPSVVFESLQRAETSIRKIGVKA